MKSIALPAFALVLSAVLAVTSPAHAKKYSVPNMVKCKDMSGHKTHCQIPSDIILVGKQKRSSTFKVDYASDCQIGSGPLKISSPIAVVNDSSGKVYHLKYWGKTSFSIKGKGPLRLKQTDASLFASDYFQGKCQLKLDIFTDACESIHAEISAMRNKISLVAEEVANRSLALLASKKHFVSVSGLPQDIACLISSYDDPFYEEIILDLEEKYENATGRLYSTSLDYCFEAQTKGLSGLARDLSCKGTSESLECFLLEEVRDQEEWFRATVDLLKEMKDSLDEYTRKLENEISDVLQILESELTKGDRESIIR